MLEELEGEVIYEKRRYGEIVEETNKSYKEYCEAYNCYMKNQGEYKYIPYKTIIKQWNQEQYYKRKKVLFQMNIKK